ncbi:methylated-DNA--[protein]-cysteine S-methyltransferase [Leptospira fluminis]|nr:methylated-DNA--[protein]-cysteine S-methyltransferase [Leptospira fluminis]
MAFVRDHASVEIIGGMNMYYYGKTQSPIGEILILSDGKDIVRVNMSKQKYAAELDSKWLENPDLKPISLAIRQFAEYFAGSRKEFDLPISFSVGSPFQRQVWKELTRIPFGTLISYGELARRIGNPSASRAVGLANGKNPIAIIVPCHRVIGSNGSLTGYGGGLDRKKFLLELELRQGKASEPSDPDLLRGIRKWIHLEQDADLFEAGCS